MSFDAMDLLRRLVPLHRTLVHDDTVRALDLLAEALPGLAVETYPSGEPAWTWRIPDKWALEEAWIEDAATGQRLWDGTCHPLAVVNYSLPFEGTLSGAELVPRLHASAARPQAIPFVYRFYDRDWGFCMPQAVKADIVARPALRVVLRTREQPGALAVGVLHLPGEDEREIVVCSNICHPGIANDSISGAVAAVDLARHLAARPRRKYSYRFLFVPETIGSVAYLSRHEDLLPRMVGGFFSEMLGNDNSLCLMFSRKGDTYWDRLALSALQESGLPFRTAPWLTSASNDEKVMDSPGVDIPSISVTRYPYPEYHTSDDCAELIDPAHLDEACALFRRMFDRIEDDYVPVYLSRGPVCLSEHGLYPNWYKDPSLKPAWDGFLKVMYALDGTRSCETLAAELGLPLSVVRHWTEGFAGRGLVRRQPYVHGR